MMGSKIKKYEKDQIKRMTTRGKSVMFADSINTTKRSARNTSINNDIAIDQTGNQKYSFGVLTQQSWKIGGQSLGK